MAYFAANAVYIAHTKDLVEDFADYLNMCGAGVVVQSNLFEGNVGTKRHNGGAYLHRCIRYSDYTTGYSALGHTSSLRLATRDKVDTDEGNFLFYYDDPRTVQMNITDVFDAVTNYTVLKYAT